MISNQKYLKNKSLLARLTKEQSDELNEIELDAIARFDGNISTLISALGFLRLGYQVGWKVLVITHNKRTVRKYEEILRIDIKELFPDEGPGAERSLGLEVAKKIGNFWKVVSGDISVEHKREIS